MTALSRPRQPSTPGRVLFFSLLALEGCAALAVLAAIPPDPKNSLLFGYSLSRLALMAVALGAALAAGGLAHGSIRQAGFLDRLLHPGRCFRLYLVTLLGISAAAWLVMAWLRVDPEGRLASYSVRLRPLLVLVWLVGWQSAAWLVLERYGFPRLGCRAARGWLRPAGIAGLVLALLVGLMALTGLGITPDLYSWNSAGVPLLAWQFGAVISIGILLYITGAGIESKLGRKALWLDVGLVALLWAVAFFTWVSQPMTPSYYAPLRPPNDTFYPYS
ncbi:MAG TPA: hypothetical protein VHO48_04285, partial [Anaerolineaceae bacterium]|nr:hypothetical protein [Anaerolineaceae bacterium]